MGACTAFLGRVSWPAALGYSPASMAPGVALDRDEVLQRVRARVLAAAAAWLPRPDAEDVAQETLVLLTTKYAHVAAAEELVALGARIVRLKCLAHWRKAKRRRVLGETPAPAGHDVEHEPFDPESGQPDPEAIAHDRQRFSMLVEAAARLDGRCREILRRKLQGASFVEIAEELGRPVNTVYSWDDRCSKRLRALLGDRFAFVSGREEPR